MEFLSRMSKVTDYIEDHLMESFSVQDLAQIVCYDTYQFGRIFAYVVGITLTEYVRNRRLSVAALELKKPHAKVIDVALKYGYDSPEAFSRAFKAFHGMAPREVSKPGAALKMFPKLTFQISIKGAFEMTYRIEEHGTIKGVGLSKNFGKWTLNSEGKTWKEQMGERWAFWNKFLNEGSDRLMSLQYKLYRKPYYQFGMTYTDEKGDLIECIGAEDAGGDYKEFIKFEVPAHTWAIFPVMGNLSQEAHPMDKTLTEIYAQWLPSSGYELASNHMLEVYGPGDTTNEAYLCEIWLPVKLKKA